MIRLGLIGVGRWGQRYLETVGHRQDCEIVAVASRSGSQLLGVRSFADWREMFELAVNHTIDAIIVATTPDNQAQVATLAVKAGVPILIEKPVGTSVAVARRVREALVANPVKPPVMVNFIHLYAPAFVAMRAIVADRVAKGETLERIESRGANAGPYRAWPSLYDYAPHDLSMCLALVPPSTWCLEQAERSMRADREGSLYDIRLRGGTTAIAIHCGNGASAKVRSLSVTLSGGDRLLYDDLEDHRLKLTLNGAAIPVSSKSPLDAVLDAFVARTTEWLHKDLHPEPSLSALQISVRIAELLEEIDVRTQQSSAVGLEPT